MQVLTRARRSAGRLAPAVRAAEFDRAVHEFFMRIALEEAAKGLGRTAPNPVVGAILVKGGRIIARGHHQRAGAPHAEAIALERAGAKCRGADLYTTLEPCDHFGRTPPCSRAILAAGIRRVICASADPNPLVDGKGLARLRRAGVAVVVGVLEAEADELNRPFFKYIRTGLPLVTLKAAVTLDGKIATATGDSRWVTGEQARLHVHRLRDEVDAIVVGANTVRRDDPRLTTRLPDGKGRDAVRVIVDSRLRLGASFQVFKQAASSRTIVATLAGAKAARRRALERLGVEIWELPARERRVDAKALLRRLGREGMLHVLVEGGAELFASFLKLKLADELRIFIAPRIVGRSGVSWAGDLGVRLMSRAMKVSDVRVERVGEDLLVRARL